MCLRGSSVVTAIFRSVLWNFTSKKGINIFECSFFKVVHSQKLDLRQKQIILLSIIEILLLKGQFERKNIIFHEKNLKHKKIILLINFIFAQTYFLIASSQFLKNDAILINHSSFFQEKDSLQLNRFQFLKMNSLMAEIIKKQFFSTKFL